MASETNATTVPAGGARFSLVPLGDVSQLSGAQLEALSVARGVSGLNRPEDGSWDPSDPHNFPADQAGPRMLDNMTVNDRGQVISLEDVGNNAYLGGVYQYDPSTGGLARIAEHDPARFTAGASNFETQDEESSGVIPAPFLGAGKYLIDVQNHRPSSDPELVEGGQLLVLQVPPGKPVG